MSNKISGVFMENREYFLAVEVEYKVSDHDKFEMSHLMVAEKAVSLVALLAVRSAVCLVVPWVH